MNEYRVKGLSCVSCTLELERRIRKLEHGNEASLSYTSGKLRLPPLVSLQAVEKLLKEERAFIVQEVGEKTSENDPAVGHKHEHGCGHDHGHDHEHGHPQQHEHEDDHEHGQEHTTGHQQKHCHDHDHGDSHQHKGHDHSHEHGHDGHDHDHSHAHGGSLLENKGLIAAAVLYGAAFFAQEYWISGLIITLYLISIFLSGYTTFMRGLRNLLKLRFNIDTLMTIALIGAIGIQEWKEAAFVSLLFGINEWLEGLGMEKARRSMSALLDSAPKEALTVVNGTEKLVPIASLRRGDLVIVKPGSQIPSDGKVAGGRSSVSEAAITGESLPVDKTVGDPVFGGSLNNEGVLHVEIEKAYHDSSLAKILHLVAEAQETKTPTELFINRFSRIYTPIIMIIAAVVILVPPLLLDGSWSKWLYQGLAVLIVGCPCALILSSPIAIISGITRNARNGILVKGGVYLEQLGKINTLAFDKTGTLTRGVPVVEEAIVYEEERFFTIAGTIERSSSHPLAKAIMKAVTDHGAELLHAEDIETLPGRGVKAVISGQTYWLGNEHSLAHLVVQPEVQEQLKQLKERGLTVVLVADDANVLGFFGIADEIREESSAVMNALHHLGMKRTVMLTGDHAISAQKVAQRVGVTEYYAELLPEDKVNKIQELAKEGRVAMIGDGINDAPALAFANLGIAMGKGTDSAIETADIVLMQDHLGKLPEAIRVAKRMNRIIFFNISCALGLKLIALLLTIPGWLTLWIAILSDMGATVFVTLVSLTILIGANKPIEPTQKRRHGG
ncbi:heavy metal translocating P-type ATPase [Paenibacillus lignilyticus]|uniref:Cd(2+)-exporting ATPase n=1 Tax=Paenibacillus lignilyticus TaxID=1172615 RepID=A0ABS5CBA9_9BACL|nr:heavy metal translocating P-type ATPase [Paenibacillus lignilyticus]MBP3963262.1 cadmium-translocating P-type ATPase [Paenibacillus lignilyticus]